MFRDDWSIDPLTLICSGLGIWLGYRTGKKNTLIQVQTETEIDRLRKEVESLKEQMKKTP
jgi:hypothetical protein